MPRVGHSASLHPQTLFAAKVADPSFGFDANRLSLTATGTGALYLAAKTLGLEGDALVLCPSYNCGHEVEAFIRAGARVAFYRIDSQLKIDFEDVGRRAEQGARAILVTHYFGLPQELTRLKSFCTDNDIYLIEDCAHVLLGTKLDRAVGTTGDVAIFSPRKFVPVPDGGALLINNESLVTPRPQKAPSLAASLLATSQLTQRSAGTRARVVQRSTAMFARALGLGLRAVRRLSPGPSWQHIGSEKLDFPTAILQWGMSDLSKRIIERSDLDAISKQRRENFEGLNRRLPDRSGIIALIPSLTPGMCPLNFPLLCENRQMLRRFFVEHGIEALNWWDQLHPVVPWHQFPDAYRLKQGVLALPIHQDVRPESLDEMTALLASG